MTEVVGSASRWGGTMVEEKFVVMLRMDAERQVWLGYNTFGNLGTTDFGYAFRYDTKTQAVNALKKARRLKSWPDAVVRSTLDQVAK